jgi:hypothetical protein
MSSSTSFPPSTTLSLPATTSSPTPQDAGPNQKITNVALPTISSALTSDAKAASSSKTLPEIEITIESHANPLVAQALDLDKSDAYRIAEDLTYLPLESEYILNHLKKLLEINPGIIKLLPKFTLLSETDRQSLIPHAFAHLDVKDQSAATDIASGLTRLPLKLEVLMDLLKKLLEINPEIIALLSQFSTLSETEHKSLISHVFTHFSTKD